MDERHRQLYISWCQSNQVKLWLDTPDGETRRFLLPRDLLRQRSRRFRDSLSHHDADLLIPDTSVQTMQDFFIWTMSPQPQLDKRTSFDAAVHLGIFSWLYQIPSLSNQVTDMIRRNLASSEWKLEATIVDEVYGAAPEDSPLREVIRAALGQLPQASGEGEGIARAEWKATFRKHADLGWDYIEASRSEWTRQGYLSDLCRFHDHKEDAYQNDSLASSDACPYAQDECYPRRDETEEEVAEVVHVNGVYRPAEELETVEEVTEMEEVDMPEPLMEVLEEEEASAPAEEEPIYPPEEASAPAPDPDLNPASESEPDYPGEEPAPASESGWAHHGPDAFEEPPHAEYSDYPADGEYTPVGEPAYGPTEETAPYDTPEDPVDDADVRINADVDDTPAPEPEHFEVSEHEHEPIPVEEAAPSESVGDEANGTVTSDTVVEDGRGAHTNGGVDGEMNGRTVAASVDTAVAEVETPKSKKKKHKNKRH